MTDFRYDEDGNLIFPYTFPIGRRIITKFGRGTIIQYYYGRVGVRHDTSPPNVDLFKDGIYYFYNHDNLELLTQD
jgi:hypothetical protein